MALHTLDTTTGVSTRQHDTNRLFPRGDDIVSIGAPNPRPSTALLLAACGGRLGLGSGAPPAAPRVTDAPARRPSGSMPAPAVAARARTGSAACRSIGRIDSAVVVRVHAVATVRTRAAAEEARRRADHVRHALVRHRADSTRWKAWASDHDEREVIVTIRWS